MLWISIGMDNLANVCINRTLVDKYCISPFYLYDHIVMLLEKEVIAATKLVNVM